MRYRYEEQEATHVSKYGSAGSSFLVLPERSLRPTTVAILADMVRERRHATAEERTMMIGCTG